MLLSYLLVPVALQVPPRYADPATDPALVQFLAGENQHAQRLGHALGKDLRPEWSDYLDDEENKARERATNRRYDDDDRLMSFAVYMDGKYRRRLRPGIILFSVGFAPLGFGLYTGLTLGEGRNGALIVAGLGGAVIVGGAILWAIRGVQLQRYRQLASGLDASRRARVQWRGLGFAF